MNIYKSIDQLGFLQAQIADLEAQAKALKASIIQAGDGSYEGDLFRATVVTSEREKLDLDAVRAKLSPQFLTAHTTHYTVQSVRLYSRNVK